MKCNETKEGRRPEGKRNGQRMTGEEREGRRKGRRKSRSVSLLRKVFLCKIVDDQKVPELQFFNATMQSRMSIK